MVMLIFIQLWPLMTEPDGEAWKLSLELVLLAKGKNVLLEGTMLSNLLPFAVNYKLISIATVLCLTVHAISTDRKFSCSFITFSLGNFMTLEGFGQHSLCLVLLMR